MLRALFILIAASLMAAPACAAEQVRIGIGFGLGFLPTYICEDLKLVEKHAGALHLNVKASYQRLLDAGAVEEEIASHTIDIGPFGVAPLLAAWQHGKDSRQQILAVSGMTTLPFALLSNQPKVHALADLRSADRIAMPTLTAPQMYFLQMAAEKIFGQYDRLRGQVVVQSHADALTALIADSGAVDTYFSSPPYTQIALKDAKVHRILGSEDVIGGKASFLVLGATRSYIGAHEKVSEAVGKAIDEAARIIRDDPGRAAHIYLSHEPSKVLDAGDIETVLRQDKEEFGSAVEGIQAFADFMSRHGELQAPPKSWKDIVAPALLNSPSS